MRKCLLLLSAGLLMAVPTAHAEGPPNCFGRPATIVGTDGQDFLEGTPENDVIVGLDGNDTIYGYGGSDRICGGRGRGILRGNSPEGGVGDGADLIRAEDQGVVMVGGVGPDLLIGGETADRIFGQAGNDRIFSRGGDDYVDAMLGDDYIDGGEDERPLGRGDEIDGGPGIDTCVNGEFLHSCEE